jgi:hypothetical protein
MDKAEVLRSISFGGRTAEEEAGNLRRIFVETEHWQSVNQGNVDIVYGSKGSGKSAIYSLLQEQRPVHLTVSRVVIPAENPRGATAFKELEIDPPATEKEFIQLWKVYFLSLIADVFPRYNIRNEYSYRVAQTLKDAALFSPESTLSDKLKAAAHYVKNIVRSVDFGVEVDPATGVSRVSLKPVVPPEARPKPLDLTPEALFDIADQAFRRSAFELWICIDRLDVAFEDNVPLETNALRALFRVYLDLLPSQRIRLKIFLRSDIWRRITEEGFREASHITRSITLVWSSAQLLNLVMKRLLQSEKVLFAYGVERPSVLADIDRQRALFYRVFPRQVDIGPKRPTAWDWILTRTRDGTGLNAPRELIHLLSVARALQMQHLDIGANSPQGENLFSGAVIREALKEVSKVRLEQTIYAEHPRLRASISRIEGEKATQTLSTLGQLWGTDATATARMADELVRVGIFEPPGPRQTTEYRVPFLYRDALRLVQGKAEIQASQVSR